MNLQTIALVGEGTAQVKQPNQELGKRDTRVNTKCLKKDQNLKT